MATTSKTNNIAITLNEARAIAITLNASELAIVVGVNPYQNIRDIIIKLWARYFMTDYSNLLNKIKTVNKIEIIQETEYECLNRLITKYKPEMKPTLAACLKSGDTADLKSNQAQILKELAANKDIPVEEKAIIEKTMKSVSNKSFGTRKEKDSIAKYEEITHKKVQRIGKYFTTPIITDHISNQSLFPKITWSIGGKIDGMTEDGEIVEVKNRVRAFFHEVREYENIQIQTYFRLLDVTSGYLVESLVKKGGQLEINVIAVAYDAEYWDTFLIPRIEKFIEFFYNIMMDEEYKMRLLLQKETVMEKEIKKALLK